MWGVAKQETHERYAYVQQNWCRQGIGLDDLREIVEATKDWSPRSHVKLSPSKVEVTETTTGQWEHPGR